LPRALGLLRLGRADDVRDLHLRVDHLDQLQVSDDLDAKLAEGDEERNVPRLAVIASSDEGLPTFACSD
jgi:hypothetical protein